MKDKSIPIAVPVFEPCIKSGGKKDKSIQIAVPISTIAVPVQETCAKGLHGVDLYINSRIKTFYTRPGIDEGKWYKGKINNIYQNNICSMEYDIGFTVEGNANCVELDEPINAIKKTPVWHCLRMSCFK